jgi:hypothetical protein
MVLYDYDSNAILTEPLKNCTSPEMIQAYKKLHAVLVSRSIQPHLQKLDNEASIALQEFMTKCNIQFQFVAPHVH